MNMDRSIARAAQTASLLFLSACSQGIKQEYDAKLDRNITRMSGNTLQEQACRPQSAGELDGQLAGCGLDQEWNRERAEEWWRLHMQPSAEGAATVAEDHSGAAGDGAVGA